MSNTTHTDLSLSAPLSQSLQRAFIDIIKIRSEDYRIYEIGWKNPVVEDTENSSFFKLKIQGDSISVSLTDGMGINSLKFQKQFSLEVTKAAKEMKLVAEDFELTIHWKEKGSVILKGIISNSPSNVSDIFQIMKDKAMALSNSTAVQIHKEEYSRNPSMPTTFYIGIEARWDVLVGLEKEDTINIAWLEKANEILKGLLFLVVRF